MVSPSSALQDSKTCLRTPLSTCDISAARTSSSGQRRGGASVGESHVAGPAGVFMEPCGSAADEVGIGFVAVDLAPLTGRSARRVPLGYDGWTARGEAGQDEHRPR